MRTWGQGAVYLELEGTRDPQIPGGPGILGNLGPAHSAIYGCGCNLMWLQFEVVRGPVGVAWGRFGALWAPNRPQIDPKRLRPDFGQPQIAAT